ncbi:hypothetical protein [Roseateles violae]|uniref:Sarcosine oxidase subunit gamma n=1 Tax=Roseateles violae TaxID=3058042 RepID=A0ABT8DXG6_9BURK|nr:hypothetical protein [Pelomonas sp. PFR6]MDN3922153.1 hypothetical protein [Pelomonas sp. PFR6]
MVEPLSVSANAFMQNLLPWIDADADRPGARRLNAMRVVSIRHITGSPAAQLALSQSGFAWPERSTDLVSADGLLATRRHAGEIIVVGDDAAALQKILHELAPGVDLEVMAIEMTHGTGVIELHGPRLDEWLAHLVDHSAIPAEGRASRCRLVDVPVLLVRPEADRIRLVADRSLFPYLAQWLAFSHEGAFSDL